MCGARRDPDSKLVVPVTMGETPPPTNRGSPIQVLIVMSLFVPSDMNFLVPITSS